MSVYPDDFGLPDRVDLARQWATALGLSGAPNATHDQLDASLLAHVDNLIAAWRADPFSAEPGEVVGRALVDAHFTTEDALRATLATITRPLVTLAITSGVDDPVGKVSELMAAVSAGYLASVRDWLFDQEEHVKRTLLLAESRAERDLYRQEEEFREMFNRAPVGIARHDADGRLIRVNPALQEILGYGADELLGRRLDEFFHPGDSTLLDSYQELFEQHGDRFRKRRRLVCADGTVSWVYLAVSVLGEGDGDPTGFLTIVENVSELHLLQEGISRQALHDGLTNLPNRQYLLSRLQTVLGQPTGTGGVALYHLDLDGFSVVNNGIGPVAGDYLLTVVARRLENLFGLDSGVDEALVVRIAGDEFAVLVPDDGGQPDVLGTVNRINEELSEPVFLEDDGGIGVAVSACIGVAHGLTGEIDPEELLRQADVTLRRAKAIGKRQWSLYDMYRDQRDRRRMRLAAALPGAWEFGQLTVAWQPWIKFADSRPGGIAARLRWDHPERGVLGHEQCLALAEETGAALQLGAWLVRSAYAQAMRWRGQFDRRTPPVSVGLTSSQASDPDLVRTVRAALRENDAPTDAIWIGFPTPALRREDGDARENLEVLVGMGVGVMLTHFGGSVSDLQFVDEWPIVATEFGSGLVRQAEAMPDSLVAKLGPAVVGVIGDLGCDIILPDVAMANGAALARWKESGITAICQREMMTADEITAMLADPPHGPVAQ